MIALKKRKQLKVAGHYMIIDGKKTPIDPKETDLPDRCKLAWAEMVTGQKYELVGKQFNVKFNVKGGLNND